MTVQELPPRQKSQRLLKRHRQRHNQLKFEQFKSKSKTINNINELLPGLNDISDAFEALPMDIIKYFTLLKEIDAKCINTIPTINGNIKEYIDTLHEEQDVKRGLPSTITSNSEQEPTITTDETKAKRLIRIKDKINDIIPCLEEKMHVTSIATDVIDKHLFRINNDYKLILNNNEIPESIRIGPLNHPAMIMDSSAPSDMSNPNRSAQSSRLETRREALAARKHKDDDTPGHSGPGRKEHTPVEKKKRSRKETPGGNNHGNNSGHSSAGSRGAGNGASAGPHGHAQTNVLGPTHHSHEGSGSAHGNHATNIHANSAKEPVTSAGQSQGNDQSRQGTPGPRKKLKTTKDEHSNNEPTYCYCNQVSFGEMVGCDGDDCKREWFHLPCIGFKNPPKGKWYCDDCIIKQKKIKRV